MKKTEHGSGATEPSRGSIELKIGPEQISTLAVSGFFGTLPLVVWGGGISLLLANHVPAAPSFPSSPSFSLAGDIFGGIVFVALILGPPLTPYLVLRARQRKGARIAWDEDGVTEWDGPWKRNAIPWNRMNAAVLSFKMIGSKSSYHTYRAVQLTHRESKTVTTVWDMRPENAPVVRRRLISRALSELIDAVQAHRIPTTSEIDFSVIEESERQRLSGARLWLARAGYVGAVVGPLTAFPEPIAGTLISVLSAGLLTWRALPVFHELERLRARVRDFALPIAETPENSEDPYRAAPPHETEKVETREAADRIRLPAVWAEAAIRAAFVLLTLVAAIANASDAAP